MIGNLVHYNCGGSSAVGIVVDWFRYESKDPRRGIPPQTIVVSVEWIKKDKVMPQSIGPRDDWQTCKSDSTYWPANWQEKKWYPLRHFRVLSKPRKNK